MSDARSTPLYCPYCGEENLFPNEASHGAWECHSCARIQVADIGLKGVLVPDGQGGDAEGFQVHLGGRLGQEAGFGRTVRGLRVAADDLTDYVERVVRTVDEKRADDETFAAWAIRAPEEDLR